MPRQKAWEPPSVPFTLSHVEPLGVTIAGVRAALDSGRITRLARGVYISTGALAIDPAGLHLQRAVAHQILRPNAIASHHSAAIAWGLDLPEPGAAAEGPVEFILPRRSGVRSKAGPDLTISVRDLPPAQRTTHPSGLNVTTAPRAAVDVASRLPLPEALIALDSAARLQLIAAVGRARLRDAYTKPRLLDAARRPLLEAAATASTLRNRSTLGQLVAIADPRRESALESRSFGEMMRASLPLPELQIGIETAMGWAYPDFLWPAAKVIGEADGLVKYSEERVLPLEKIRQELLEQLGYRVVRWDARGITQRTAAVIRRIADALHARGALGGW